MSDERPNIVKHPTEDMTLYTGGFGSGLVWLALTILLSSAMTSRAESIVLEFTQAGCHFCESVAPAVAQRQRLGFDIRETRIETKIGGDLASAFRIKTTPTFVVFQLDARDKVVKELDRYEGDVPARLDELLKTNRIKPRLSGAVRK